MNRTVFYFLLSFPLLAFNCADRPLPPPLPGYDIQSPDRQLILPDTLHEISGLTEMDSNTFACVQDELGTLFMVDINNNNIVSSFSFGPPGDYEAVARVGKTLYVLRSDGVIFEILNAQKTTRKINTYFTYIPASNNEGLCYDAANNRLLIGCKSKPGKGPEYKNIRAIYGFDLKTKKATTSPVYTIQVDKIIQFAQMNNIILPVKSKGKNVVPVLKFSTSEIAIHPINGQLYLLSAADHMMFVFDRSGKIQHIEKLDAVMFNKPEGISFLDNGDMIITNEGQNHKPTLLRFNYRSEK